MHFSSFILTIALAVLATAQSTKDIPALVASLPSCAVQPLTKAIVAAGCGVLDYACQCGPGKSAILGQATSPILAACPISEALSVQSITDKICVAAGVSSGGGGAAPPVGAASSFASSASSFASFASSASSIPSSIPATFTTTTTVPTVTANAASRARPGSAALGAAVLVAIVL